MAVARVLEKLTILMAVSMMVSGKTTKNMEQGSSSILMGLDTMASGRETNVKVMALIHMGMVISTREIGIATCKTVRGHTISQMVIFIRESG